MVLYRYSTILLRNRYRRVGGRYYGTRKRNSLVVFGGLGRWFVDGSVPYLRRTFHERSAPIRPSTAKERNSKKSLKERKKMFSSSWQQDWQMFKAMMNLLPWQEKILNSLVVSFCCLELQPRDDCWHGESGGEGSRGTEWFISPVSSYYRKKILSRLFFAKRKEGGCLREFLVVRGGGGDAGRRRRRRRLGLMDGRWRLRQKAKNESGGGERAFYSYY